MVNPMGQTLPSFPAAHSTSETELNGAAVERSPTASGGKDEFHLVPI